MKSNAKSCLSFIETAARLFWILLLVLAPLVVQSQTSSSTEGDNLRKLDFMVGEWKGKGWHYHFDGSRVELSQTAKVKRASAGTALRVDYSKKLKAIQFGLPLTLSGPATIYYDEKAKLYRWRIETSEGRKNPFEANVIGPKAFQWIMRFPGSVARITIIVTDEEEWHELWETWTDNKVGWRKYQESVLGKEK